MSNFQLIMLAIAAVFVVVYVLKRNSRLKRDNMD
jgi:hypothetical protein